MINVFDFDHTIYDGDVSLDFYFYSLRKHPLLIRYFPLQCWGAFLYLASAITRTKFKQSFFIFLDGLRDVDKDIEGFWKIHERKIKKWYKDRPSHNSDVIISASPEFIIAPIARNMRVHMLIATKMDKSTGKIHGINCRGKEKVKRLHLAINSFSIEECYSDSMADLPLLNIAKKKFIVKKMRVIPFDDYRPSGFKQRFFRKDFLTFIFVGGLNAVIGLSFAFAMSMLLDNKTVAFMIGYVLGLVPSYFLNSTMTFHNRDYNIRAFIKYCISYIPNFLVQTLCVGLLIEVLKINTLVSYILAVVVGVPITFFIVSVFAIKNKEVE